MARLRIASRAEDTFGSLVALGLTTMIAVQAFVNMSVVLGLMPTKGIPLPLVSTGGSSLLISLLGDGRAAEHLAARVASVSGCSASAQVRCCVE